MVHDAHVHFFSHAFYAGLARQKGLKSAAEAAAMAGHEPPPEDPGDLAHRWIAELDRNRVDRACLIASAHGDEDSVAAAVALYPRRFFGYFLLDPLAEDALERIRRAAANPHLHCVCLFPAMHRVSVADPRLTPIFETIAASRLRVFVHCGALSVGIRNKLGLASRFDMRYSNPLEIHPLAAQFPAIQFVVPHFGAGMLRETLLLADLCPNVWLDTSSSNKWMAYEGLDLPAVYQRAINAIGPERLIFGTDSSFFPRGWNGTILEKHEAALDATGVSAAQREAIFSGNLERLLNPS